MNDNINTFYSDLRKIKEGKFTIFLGVGRAMITVFQQWKRWRGILSEESFTI